MVSNLTARNRAIMLIIGSLRAQGSVKEHRQLLWGSGRRCEEVPFDCPGLYVLSPSTAAQRAKAYLKKGTVVGENNVSEIHNL
jgi:hypothetical protein